MIEFTSILLLSALRLATPLAYASLGGYACERSGTVNIGLEGLMLVSAFSAAAFASLTHSAIGGLFIGIFASLILASVHGFLCIELRADQMISGMAINFLAMGLAPVLCRSLFLMTGGTPILLVSERISPVFGISPMILFLGLLIPLIGLFNQYSRQAIYLRFAGEHPEALNTQGISVRRTRWAGVLLSGVFCGLAGAYLSIDHGSGFSRNMIAGRGFIALAALIISGWNPVRTIFVSLCFGFIEAVQIFLQGLTFADGMSIPVQWIQVFPYIITLFVLAAIGMGKNLTQKPPKRLGCPYINTT